RGRHLDLGLLDAAGLEEPVKDGLVAHDLGSAELDDVAEQFGFRHGFDDAARRILAEDRLHLRLAAARNQSEWTDERALEVVEDAAFFGDDEREAEDRARDAGLGQLLLP